jgi:hypothetical protein
MNINDDHIYASMVTAPVQAAHRLWAVLDPSSQLRNEAVRLKQV